MKINAPVKSPSPHTMADQHRLFIAECCQAQNTNVTGLYDAYADFKRTPGWTKASIYDFLMERCSQLAAKYDKLNATAMKKYMLEMKKLEETQLVPPGVEARMMAGDAVSVITNPPDRQSDRVDRMDLNSVTSENSGMQSLVRHVGNMVVREDESMDGDQSMHTAHSQRHYMPLTTSQRRSVRCSRIDQFDFVSFVVQSLQLKDGVVNTEELINGVAMEDISNCAQKIEAMIGKLDKIAAGLRLKLANKTDDAGLDTEIQKPMAAATSNGEEQG